MKHNCISRKYPARSAVSLIEMVAVMSIMGTVMTVLVSILFHCMKTDQHFSETGHTLQTINALATDLRNDIHFHSLKNFQLDPKQQTLKISAQVVSTEIVYRWNDHRLSREVQTGKNQPQNREHYWFPKGSKIQWKLDDKTNTVSLQIDQPNGSNNRTLSKQASYHKLVIEAEAGRFVLPIAKGAAP